MIVVRRAAVDLAPGIAARRRNQPTGPRSLRNRDGTQNTTRPARAEYRRTGRRADEPERCLLSERKNGRDRQGHESQPNNPIYASDKKKARKKRPIHFVDHPNELIRPALGSPSCAIAKVGALARKDSEPIRKGGNHHIHLWRGFLVWASRRHLALPFVPYFRVSRALTPGPSPMCVRGSFRIASLVQFRAVCSPVFSYLGEIGKHMAVRDVKLELTCF